MDPYFSERALFYAYLTSRIAIPIKILGASFYLRKKAGEEVEMRTHAELLQSQLLDFREKFPNQAVECRVLKGRSGSQLHDRYIVSDDDVYLLGSSFHDFGGRATTIFKVPAPDEMISKAYEWLRDEHSIDLDTFVERIKSKTDDTEGD